ncbi:type I methionyl aminopeptidase [Rhizobiaceae bacterium BDR2-2]|uniref:Methionine aminopeptidase n=1 Tax=Ectorhizobium quercum TaxID=2965071 RepID=A0AAE3SVQ7_9HYPH|nr:type I methionyl aminopeptidase [Ectorhizobium quercum]MCX8996640.1 type I methionyl aminopeptidase [Ectorhizobium quercum]
MVISSQEEFGKMRDIGRICARTLQTMSEALRPGITTRELDEIGRRALEAAGARSAPELCYQFPGATCISVNEEVAHGIPGERVIKAGDLVNIDVSAEKDGFFSDTGASFTVGKTAPKISRLLRDGKRACWLGIGEVKADKPLASIGQAIGTFAAKNRYTLIANLASHGIGRSLHEEPTELSTWPDPDEKRIMQDGLVFTIEPFLSLGGQWAEDSDGEDDWTLYSSPKAPTVQFEHTVVCTRNGPVVLTLPD